MDDHELLEQIFANCEVAGPVSDHDIENAEVALGITFPHTYRTFLSLYGAALCDGFEIFGLMPSFQKNDPPLWTDVVALNLRNQGADFISPPYVEVSDNGADHSFFIDTSQSQGPHPVVAFGPGVDGKVVAEDFLAFVRKLRDSEIELY
jgi:hypothetical protein